MAMFETKCPKCGKMFIPAPQHAHVDNKGFYCKPTCWLHRNDGVRDKRRYNGKKRVIQLGLDGEAITIFESAHDAAEAVGGIYQSVAKACREGVKCYGYLWKYEERCV